MKLLEAFKSLILEQDIFLGGSKVDGNTVNIFYNQHSNMAISDSKYGRTYIDDIKNSMVDILDIIVEVAAKIIQSEPKNSRKHSILVIDNQIGVDYHFWLNKSKSDIFYLTINTSIRHPRHLPRHKNDATIIITRLGETIIKESFFTDFTYNILSDKIVYYKIN